MGASETCQWEMRIVLHVFAQVQPFNGSRQPQMSDPLMQVQPSFEEIKVSLEQQRMPAGPGLLQVG